MPEIKPDALSRLNVVDPLEDLRICLEDTLKEYAEFDLCVEVLQNAIDSMEQDRYVKLCNLASLDPNSSDTIALWNSAVDDLIQEDAKEYALCNSPAKKSVYYEKCLDEKTRKQKWLETIADKFDVDIEKANLTLNNNAPRLTIIIRPDDPYWLEVIDNGIGMDDILKCFSHTSSSKRVKHNVARRYGIRGSHGWGLSAVLGMSDCVEVLSKVEGGDPKAYKFADYASFAAGAVAQPSNSELEINGKDIDYFDKNLLKKESHGTHIRVRLSNISEDNVFGDAVINFTPNKFINFLRMYTPVGQINDYVLHPAYHTYRKKDIKVKLKIVGGASAGDHEVPFDVFRLSELPSTPSQDYNKYFCGGMKENVSVHTIHRAIKAGVYYLSGAEIQPAAIAANCEIVLAENNALPEYTDENENEIKKIPRGFYLALSGGMKSEYMVKPPTGSSAAFRGFVLAESAKPTLGRKHVLDQRTSIAKAAAEHENIYDDVRRAVLPKGGAGGAGIKGAKWRRKLLDQILADLKNQAPQSESLYVWAGNESGEARVMLMFSELLSQDIFGPIKLLRCGLGDTYDFVFLYQGFTNEPTAPSASKLQQLFDEGYIEFDKKSGKFERYAIGEFKSDGQRFLDDLEEDEPSKNSDHVDMLVCWDFEKSDVEHMDWSVEDIEFNTKEFPGQTHTWYPGPTINNRTRPLAVVSLKQLIDAKVVDKTFGQAPSVWPDLLPENYY